MTQTYPLVTFVMPGLYWYRPKGWPYYILLNVAKGEDDELVAIDLVNPMSNFSGESVSELSRSGVWRGPIVPPRLDHKGEDLGQPSSQHSYGRWDL